MLRLSVALLHKPRRFTRGTLGDREVVADRERFGDVFRFVGVARGEVGRGVVPVERWVLKRVEP
jgi:hypothetical protein